MGGPSPREAEVSADGEERVDGGAPAEKEATPMPGMTPPSIEYDLFLSHGKPDKRWVRKLKQHLDRLGIRSFLDRDIRPGKNYVIELHTALAKSRCLAVIMTKRSMPRPWVEREVTTFLAEHGARRPIIAVELEPVKRPPYMTVDQSLPAHHRRPKQVAEELARCVGKGREEPVDDGPDDGGPGLGREVALWLGLAAVVILVASWYVDDRCEGVWRLPGFVAAAAGALGISWFAAFRARGRRRASRAGRVLDSLTSPVAVLGVAILFAGLIPFQLVPTLELVPSGALTKYLNEEVKPNIPGLKTVQISVILNLGGKDWKSDFGDGRIWIGNTPRRERYRSAGYQVWDTVVSPKQVLQIREVWVLKKQGPYKLYEHFTPQKATVQHPHDFRNRPQHIEY